MRAYVLHQVGDLRYEDIAIPSFPSLDWALVQVKAAGICSSDIPRVFSKGTYHFPTIPGHEFSGVVVDVADKKNRLWVGKRVGVFPLIPCKKCKQCKETHYEMCESYDYLGSRRDGGFAEYVMVPIWNLIELPKTVSFITAAMLEPFSVAYHAIDRCHIQGGEKVAVVGTGMIGICAGQWAKNCGASKVTVIGRSESKRRIVEDCGLEFETRQQDPIFDVVVEAVGSPLSISQTIEMATPSGRIVLMGNPSGDILLSQSVYWRVLRKQLTLMGTWNSSYNGVDKSDWGKAISSVMNHEIYTDSLITHQFRQDELEKGLTLMKNHKEPYCKVMTIWGE